MACEHILEQLHAYLDGLLDTQTREALEAHIRQCGACRREFEELRALGRLLRSVPPVSAPAHLAASIMAQIEREQTAGERPILRLLPRVALVAASLLVVAGVLLITANDRRQVESERIAYQRQARLWQLPSTETAPAAPAERMSAAVAKDGMLMGTPLSGAEHLADKKREYDGMKGPSDDAKAALAETRSSAAPVAAQPPPTDFARKMEMGKSSAGHAAQTAPVPSPPRVKMEEAALAAKSALNGTDESGRTPAPGLHAGAMRQRLERTESGRGGAVAPAPAYGWWVSGQDPVAVGNRLLALAPASARRDAAFLTVEDGSWAMLTLEVDAGTEQRLLAACADEKLGVRRMLQASDRPVGTEEQRDQLEKSVVAGVGTVATNGSAASLAEPAADTAKAGPVRQFVPSAAPAKPAAPVAREMEAGEAPQGVTPAPRRRIVIILVRSDPAGRTP